MGFVVIFVLAVVVGAVLWYLQTVAATKRRQRMSDVAITHGLSFSAKDPFHMPDTVPLAFFDRGHSRKVNNVMYGLTAEGRDRRAFDYQYTMGSGKNRQLHTFSCGLISTGATWPQLTLGPWLAALPGAGEGSVSGPSAPGTLCRSWASSSSS